VGVKKPTAMTAMAATTMAGIVATAEMVATATTTMA
jgi:hypothetical protein